MPELRVQYAVGDALVELTALPDESVDAIVTDPPYGLSKEPNIVEVLTHWLAGDDYVHRGGGFMGKTWDSFVPGPSVWKQCFRVLKPGGHLLCFAGTRTVDLMGISLRLGGFEIRDEIAWLYGSGFPKSMDVSKAIDKAARGVPQGGPDPTSPHHGQYKTQATEGKRGEGDKGQGFGAGPGQFMKVGDIDPNTGRKIVAVVKNRSPHAQAEGWGNPGTDEWYKAKKGTQPMLVTEPATPEAAEWEGWGTALKPAHEPIIVARKPLIGTVAANVLTHGTGALNIDATRVSTTDNLNGGTYSEGGNKSGLPGDERDAKGAGMFAEGGGRIPGGFQQPEGRWPANIVLSHDERCVQVGERQVKTSDPRRADGSVSGMLGTNGVYGGGAQYNMEKPRYGGDDGTESIEAWECVPGCPVAELDAQSGTSKSSGGRVANISKTSTIYGGGNGLGQDIDPNDVKGDPGFGDTGGASRFFYNAKASKSERSAGMPEGQKNDHPTVKPVALMRWLVRMVTQPGGTVLDPYMGSGTTAVACVYEGFNFMGIEKNEPYVTDIAVHRVRYAKAHANDPILSKAGEERAKRAKGVPPVVVEPTNDPSTPRKSPKIPAVEVKVVACRDCGKGVETSIHWDGAVVCRECSRVKEGVK